MRHILTCIFFLVSSAILKASVQNDSVIVHQKDTIKDPIVRNLRFDNLYAVPTLLTKDTVNENLYRSLPYYKSTLYPGYLGVIGQAAYSLSYFDNKRLTDNPFLTPFGLSFYSKTDKVYYNTRQPYTILQFMGSANVLESFKALYTQNINKEWNVGFEMNFYGSEGAYTKQKASTHQAKVFTTYFGSRYSIVSQYSINRLFSNENGGVDVTKMRDSKYSDSKSLPVSLSNANSVTRYTQCYVKQEFNLSGRYRKPDSLKVELNEFPICLGHEMTYEKSFRSFKETLSKYSASLYGNSGIDTLKTKDSSQGKTITNFLYLKASSNMDRANVQTLIVGYGVELEKNIFVDHEMWGRVSQFYNSYVQSNVWNVTKTHKGIDASARYYFPGRKQGNIEAQVRAYKDFQKFDSVRLEATVDAQIASPSYFHTTYRSNHFSWNNSLVKQQTITASVKIQSLFDKFHIKASASLLQNHIYVSENMTVTQYNPEIIVYSLDAGKQTNIGILYLSNNIVFQQSTNSIVSLPQFVTSNTIAIKSMFFKNALTMKTGFDLYFWTKFHAPAYMPELGVFHNQSTRTYGDYPFVDAFLQFDFKRMQAFFKYSHASYYITSSNYFFSVDHYPLDKPTFSYGLSWYFYN